MVRGVLVSSPPDGHLGPKQAEAAQQGQGCKVTEALGSALGRPQSMSWALSLRHESHAVLKPRPSFRAAGGCRPPPPRPPRSGGLGSYLAAVTSLCSWGKSLFFSGPQSPHLEPWGVDR